MTTKHALITMAAPLALLASPAEAADFVFTLSGATTASFVVEAAKLAPPAEVDPDFFIVEDVAGTFAGVSQIAESITFNALSFSGGLTIQLGGTFLGFLGDQLFTGTTAAPVFAPGTFTLRSDTDNAVSTLTIAAVAPVPEPATWAMMIGGFGAVGVAMRRRTAVRASHA